MTKFTIFFVLFLFLPINDSWDSSKVKSKKTVFIIVDGISWDQLKAANTPNLDQIGIVGAMSEAYVGGGKDTYSETPTISAVGYNSLLTGTWVNKHRVYGNSIKNPNYHYPSVFRLYKDQYPDGKSAVFSSWLDNRTKLVGDGLKETNHIKVDYAFDGMEYDTINYPHDKKRNFMKLIDLNVALDASEKILEMGPDLSWVYLEYTDDIGHAYGDSPQLSAAITFEDDLVGRIFDAINEREKNYKNEEWLLVVTTDHGRKKSDGKGHGGQSDRERSTWIATNSKNTNFYFKNEIPAIVDILPTITDFMEIDVPRDTRLEWDGVSLIRPVDAVNLKTTEEEGQLYLTWKCLQQGKGKIFISNTNHFETGGKDQYELISPIALKNEKVMLPMDKIPKGFCKIILETPNNTLNTWLNVK